MRVIAGQARGRRLQSPPDHRARPTSDRVREAVFNALGSMDAVVDARVADLFAGTGALGLEARSRGAAEVVFVESDPAMVRILEENVTRVGLDGTRVVTGDVMSWLLSGPGRFDLVLADPPYAFDRWDELLAGLDAAVVVVESDRAVEPPPGWVVLRTRTYGSTVVTIVSERAGA